MDALLHKSTHFPGKLAKAGALLAHHQGEDKRILHILYFIVSNNLNTMKKTFHSSFPNTPNVTCIMKSLMSEEVYILKFNSQLTTLHHFLPRMSLSKLTME